MSAIELAERHGWTDEPATGIAYLFHGAVLAWQGRLEEAGPWVQRAERVLRAEAEPAAVLAVQYTRGVLELGRDAGAALAAFQAAERLAGGLAAPQSSSRRRGHCWCTPWCAWAKRACQQALAGFGDPDAGKSASPPRCCRSPGTTRAPRWPRSPRSWTAPRRCCGRPG